MKLQLTLILALLNFTLFGQNIVEGFIKNADTQEPIPFVNIGIINKDKGTVSNDQGFFSLEIPDEFNLDTLRISSIAYHTKSYIINDFFKIINTNTGIELLPEVVTLNEIIVSTKNLKETILGNKTKSKRLRGGFRNAPLGHELGIKIKLKNKQTSIEKFQTHITSNTGTSMKFRLNFYDIKNKLPNKRIVNENIIFQIGVKNGDFTLDLSKYNIVLNDDFYFTVELIDNQKEGEEIFFSAGLLGNPILTRQTSQGAWKKLGSVGIGFNLIVKQ